MLVISCPKNHASTSKDGSKQEWCCQELKRLEALVQHYTNLKPGVTPPNARMTPGLKIHKQPDWKPSDAWKYAWFVATKGMYTLINSISSGELTLGHLQRRK